MTAGGAAPAGPAPAGPGRTSRLRGLIGLVAGFSAIPAPAAAQEACQKIGLGDVTGVAAPAVIVLGERHGTQPDLARAARVVRGLDGDQPVTVALEAVHRDRQAVLDQIETGAVALEDAPQALEWDSAWGYPWPPYEPIFVAGQRGASLVAAGVTRGPPPPDAPEFPIPSGYIHLLVDAMAGHEVAPGMQDRFTRSMAWRDYAIASAAVEGWDGTGYLVILTGRGHVEGGKGVAWQAAQLTDKPVHAFVLAWGGNPPCHAGDKIWRVGLFG